MNENDGVCRSLCQGVQVPTEEELTALDAMRVIKREVKVLKERIRRLSTSEDESSREERAEMESRVDRFRREWQEWEEKRRDAAARRMVLLGHEKP